jgi:hypothetical protein
MTAPPLAEKLAPVASMPAPAWPDRQGYAIQLGQTYDDIRRARANRLFLFDDIHQNRGKAERFLKLRELMKVQNAPAREKIVNLMRGGQGKQRSVSNEGELVNTLIKHNCDQSRDTQRRRINPPAGRRADHHQCTRQSAITCLVQPAGHGCRLGTATT